MQWFKLKEQGFVNVSIDTFTEMVDNERCAHF